MTDNKIVEVLAKSYDDRITKVFKKSQENNSETVTKENDKEIPKERYIPSEERQTIIDNLDVNIMV